jgi:hypothetical protein
MTPGTAPPDQRSACHHVRSGRRWTRGNADRVLPCRRRVGWPPADVTVRRPRWGRVEDESLQLTDVRSKVQPPHSAT